MGSKGSQVTQQQTYSPNPQAAGAIGKALGQAQGVAQTPFHTPTAPVAGFSNDQLHAFQNTNAAQGWAQPYINSAQDYFSGNRTQDFFNPFASNVMAGMKDLFGQQKQQTTGNLVNQAGGVGADRVAVGEAELGRQQSLAAGQTLAGLYSPAAQMAQNAGFGIGALGPAAQNSVFQGIQAQLGTGGLQQQLQQAQINAPYQNQLAQIQWPYQNAQFNAGITASLAPGMGGTTSGQTTYPQQNPWGTIAGLGMAGLGAYGASGGFDGWGGGGDPNFNSDGSMAGLPQNFQSPAYNPATNTINPNYTAARGGRINGYAEGGGVDDGMINLSRQGDGSYGEDPIRSAEIKELQDAGGFHGGNSSPLAAGANTHPIDVSAHAMLPDGKIPAIQPHIPQLQAPQQQGGSGSGGGGDMVKMAATVLPFLLNRGGAVNPYADGGSVAERFNPNTWGRPEPVPEGEGFWQNFLKQNPFGTALMGLKPGALKMTPTAHANPQLQLHGRFTRPQEHGAYMQHRSIGKWPFIASAQLAANAPGGDIPHDDAPLLQRQNDAVAAGGEMGKGLDADSFADRFGGMVPPSPSQGEAPLFMRSGLQDAPPPRSAPDHVPLPRSNPFVALAMEYEARKQASLGAPRETGREAPPEMPERAPPYRPTRFAAGGGVDGEGAAEEEMAPFSHRQSALGEADPFERAALRTRESVRPTSGRKDGPLMGAAMTALSLAGGPEAALARFAPRIGAALYGLGAGSAPTEAGEQNFKWEDPVTERVREMAAIQARIDQRAAKITDLGTTSTKSPAGTQKLAIDQLSSLNHPEAPDMVRLKQLRDAAGGERDSAFQQWQTAQNDARREATERKAAETSLFDKIPGTRAAITTLSPVASYFGSRYLGKRLSPWASVPIGTTTGAIEGAASIGLPTEVDINSLPRTSATRQEAEADLGKDSYWQRVGLAAGVSGAAGALGATKGYASTRPILTPRTAALPDAAEKAVRMTKSKNTFGPAKISDPVMLPDGTKLVQYDHGSRTVWRKNGRPIKNTEAEALISKAPTSPAPLQMQAAGGRVHYEEGGGVDWPEPPADTNPWPRPTNLSNDKVPNWFSSLQDDVDSGRGLVTLPGKFPQMRNPPGTPNTAMDRGQGLRREAAPDENDSDDGALPPNASSTVGGNPFASPASSNGPATNRRKDLVDSPWMALMQAGLGTMAAAGHRDAHGLPTQPFAAIGQGGMKGMETLREQQTAGMKQQSIDQAARKLEADALRYQRGFAETERHNRSLEAHQKEQEGHQRELLKLQQQRLGTGLFDAETVDTMAEQALRGDKSVFANLGRGVAGPQNIVQVRQRMNELARQRGITGADLAALNANFGAQSAAARTAAVREANISTAVEEAKGTFPLALAASGALSRTDFTPINKLLAAVRSGTSTPEQAEFALAHQAVITAYSQAMSRTGVNTVHAQERAEKAFSDVQNHESYERSIKQLEREMAVAVAAPEKARQMILDRISGKTSPEEKPAAASGNKKDEFTGRTATNPKTGKKVREKSDGSWVE